MYSNKKEFDEARMQMWASLIPGYLDKTANQKKKAKERFRKMSTLGPQITAQDIINRCKEWHEGYFYDASLPLDTCTGSFDIAVPTTVPTPRKKPLSQMIKEATVEPKKRKKDENMYVEQNMTVKEKTTEDSRLEHFIHRIDRLSWDKENEMMIHFGLQRKSPKNPKEMVEWIKSGDFIFTKEVEEMDEDTCWYSLLHGIKWTKIKEDRKGFEAACKEMEKSKKDYVDLLWAETDTTKFPEIIKKFEKAKFH